MSMLNRLHQRLLHSTGHRPLPMSAQPPQIVLAPCLAGAREQFLSPDRRPCHSLMVAADLTAADLSVQDCVELLMAVSDDVRAQVYERAGWFWPRVPNACDWQHFLRCLASLALECSLREAEDLVEMERSAYGRWGLPSVCALAPKFPEMTTG